MTTNPQILADLQAAQTLYDAFYSKVNPLKAAAGIPTVPTGNIVNTFKDYFPSSAGTNYLLSRLPSTSKSTSATKDSTDKLTGSDLVREQLATEKAKLAGAGKAGSSGRHFWDDLAENTLGGLAKSVDFITRPGKAVTSALYELDQQLNPYAGTPVDTAGEAAGAGSAPIKKDEFTPGANMWSNVYSRGLAGLFNEPKAKTTSQIIESTPAWQHMSGGWQKTALKEGGGLIGDIVLDPFSWTTAGTTTLGKTAAERTLATLAEKELLSPGVLGAAQKVIGLTEKGGTVAQGTRSLTSAELKTRVAAATAEKAAGKGIRQKAERIVSKEAKAFEKRVGEAMPAEMRATRVAEEAFKMTEPFQQQLTKAVVAANKRRVAVRIVGKDILGGKTGQKIGRGLYKPFEVAGAGANKVLPIRALKEAFQVGNHFPGITAQIRRLTESRGIREHEIWAKTVDKTVRGLSKDTRRTILKDLERGVRTTGEENGKDLGTVWDFFNQYRHDQFAILNEAEIYDATKQAENFVPQFYRRGSTEDIKKFKQTRKNGIHNPGSVDPSKYSLESAKEAGLRPFDTVDDAFKMYDADVTRKLVRRNYQLGILDHYGIRAGSEAAANFEKMGFTQATDLMRPADREMLKGLKEAMYIHPEIQKTVKAMDDMLKAGNHEDLNRMMRLVDRVTNMWKRSATVWNPGNWFNNSLGDITMNFLDGVQNPIWYKRSLQLLREAPNGTMRIGGVEIDKSIIKELYNQFSSGAGFLRAEVDTNIASKLGNALNKGFAGREDFGRMAHFMHALNSELKLRGGLKDLNTLLAKNPTLEELGKSAAGRKLIESSRAAGERVSKWNIDYSAFTPFERKVKKVIPFYAWQRKSIPLLLEAMATKPGRVAAVRKTQTAISQMLGGDFASQQGQYNVEYPFWLRQSGFMRTSGGEEPTVITDPTPLAMMGKTFGAASISDLLRNQVASVNPLAKVPLELAFKEQAFSGQKLPTDMKQYWLSQLPMTSAAGAMSGSDIRGNDLTGWERLGTFLGSKPYTVTDKRQAGELQHQKDPIDAQLTKVNKALKESPQHVVIRKVKGGYKVVNDETEYDFGTRKDPGSAMALAVSVAGIG